MDKKLTCKETGQEVAKLHIEIAKKESDLREIQELTKTGNWEWDLKKQTLVWSEQVFNIFGLEYGKFKPSAEAFESFIHPDDLEYFLQKRESMLKEQKKACIDHRIVLPDGSVKYVQERAQLIFDNKNELHRIIGTVQDITERKEMEQQLQESEERFRLIFDNSIDGILFSSPDGNIFSANPSACKMLGRSEQEICEGKRDLVVDLTDPRLHEALEHRKATGQFRGELNYRRRDGEIFPVEISSAVFALRNGETRSYIIFRDISERKQIEAERERTIQELRSAIDQIRTLRGIIPICANCKKIRNDKGYWDQVESYISLHTDAKFSHGICPDCMKELYPEIFG